MKFRMISGLIVLSMSHALASEDTALLDSFKKPPRPVPQKINVKHGDTLRIVNKMWGKPLSYVTWNECAEQRHESECKKLKSMWVIGLPTKPTGKGWDEDDSEYVMFGANPETAVAWTIDRGELGAGDLKYGDVVALVIEGKYLTGDLGDFITRLSPKKDVWEKFIVVSTQDKTGPVARGDTVAFQTFKNDNKNNPRYLTISDSGKAIIEKAGTRGSKGPRQQFIFTK
jgi:hypothetical protein